MRKTIITFCQMLLMLFLISCNSEQISQFNEEINQEIILYGVSFQLPSEWEKTYEDSENVTFSESNKDGTFKNCLMVTICRDIGLEDAYGDLEYGLSMLEENGANIKDLNNTSFTVDGMSAKKVKYNKKYDGNNDLIEIVMLETDDGTVEITFYADNEMGYSDFDKVIKSITLAKGTS